jgi:hypothetical protein
MKQKMLILFTTHSWQFGNTSTFYRRFFGHSELLLLLTADFLAIWKYVYFLPQNFRCSVNIPTFYHTEFANPCIDIAIISIEYTNKQSKSESNVGQLLAWLLSLPDECGSSIPVNWWLIKVGEILFVVN